MAATSDLPDQAPHDVVGGPFAYTARPSAGNGLTESAGGPTSAGDDRRRAW